MGQAQAPPRVPQPSPAAHTPTAAIRGRVLARPSDSPIRNARVRLEDVPEIAVAFTDREGQFELHAVPPGRHSLSVIKTGYARALSGDERLPPIVIDTAATDVAVVIDLEPAAAITGRVLDDAGAP